MKSCGESVRSQLDLEKKIQPREGFSGYRGSDCYGKREKKS